VIVPGLQSQNRVCPACDPPPQLKVHCITRSSRHATALFRRSHPHGFAPCLASACKESNQSGPGGQLGRSHGWDVLDSGHFADHSNVERCSRGRGLTHRRHEPIVKKKAMRSGRRGSVAPADADKPNHYDDKQRQHRSPSRTAIVQFSYGHGLPNPKLHRKKNGSNCCGEVYLTGRNPAVNTSRRADDNPEHGRRETAGNHYGPANAPIKLAWVPKFYRCFAITRQSLRRAAWHTIGSG